MNPETGQPAEVNDRAAYVAPARPRPLLLPTLAFMAGIVASEFLGVGTAALRGVAFLVPIVALALFLSFAVRRKATPYLSQALLIVAALGVGFARHQFALRLEPNRVAHLATDEPILTRISGRIVTQPTTTPGEKRNPFLPTAPSPRTRFVLSASELRTIDVPVPITGLIRVSVEAEQIDARFGDEVVVTGKLYRPRGPRNPGETDWARWNRAQSVYAGIAVDAAVHVQRIGAARGTVRGLIGLLRAKTQSLLFEPFEQVESDQPIRLLDAMVLGHRSAAGRRINQAFVRTGTSHFLAVSGFHVGVLIGLAWLLARRVLRRSSRCAATATIVVILLYMLIAEQNAPILRAGTMGLLACLARLCRRPLLSLNWLALSALCVLTYNPLQLFRPGFQLSFVLTLALFIMVPPAYRWVMFRKRELDVPTDADSWLALFRRWAWRWFVGLAIANLCLWANSIPLKLHHFGYFGPWSPLQSMVILPIVVATIVLGFLTLVTTPILPALGALLGVMLRVSTDLLLWVVDKLSLLPGTFIEVRRLPAWIVALTYCFLLLLLWYLHARKRHAAGESIRPRATVRAALLATCGAIAVSVWLGWLVAPVGGRGRDCAIHVLSVGSGTAVLVTTPNEHALLYDVGTMHNFDAGETVVRAARALGVRRLDGLVLSHANFDHYSGAATLLRGVPTERLLFNPYFQASATESPTVLQFFDSLPAESPPRLTLRAGDRFSLGEASIEVLWPPDDLDGDWSPNNRSVVLRISANGHSVMLAGDIEREAIRELLDWHAVGRINLFSDVLIAPHHGSVVPGDTAAFYEAVSPLIVVNSTSRERPKLATLVGETLGQSTRLISTRTAGAISVRIAPMGELNVETPFVSGRQ